MSTVFYIKSNNIGQQPRGFRKLDWENAYVYFDFNFMTKTLAATKDGIFFFPEDYPNKREYLKAIKLCKGSIFSDFYRLTSETIVFLQGLPCQTTFGLLDIADCNHGAQIATKIFAQKLSSRDIFKFRNFYELL